jgi:pimeloyl-ACP methyl ester carboxylesterase
MVSCGSTHTDGAPSRDFNRLPVLMVHGSGLDSSYWGRLARALVADGYPQEYVRAIDMFPRNGGNVIAAERYIRPAVAELLKIAGRESLREGLPAPQKVILVSHSMGAISTRWFTARIAPQEVGAWLGIAPANHGTHEMCGYYSAGEVELCPLLAGSSSGSPLLQALNGSRESAVDESPFGSGEDTGPRPAVLPDRDRRLSYWTLRIDPDEWIVPADSAILDGAGGLPLSLPQDLPVRATSPGNFLFDSAVRHDDLPADPHVIRWVLEIVRAVNREAAVRAT